VIDAQRQPPERATQPRSLGVERRRPIRIVGNELQRDVPASHQMSANDPVVELDTKARSIRNLN
jgi:hypothetical protein